MMQSCFRSAVVKASEFQWIPLPPHGVDVALEFTVDLDIERISAH
jgi:hypothetical protein